MMILRSGMVSRLENHYHKPRFRQGGVEVNNVHPQGIDHDNKPGQA